MRSFLIIACLLPILTVAQNWSDTLALRMANWHAVRARASALTQEEVNDNDWHINTDLGKAMAAVLRVPGLSDHSIDSLFPGDPFDHVRSSDGRLTIFQWDERTGGTFQALVHLVFYRDARGEGHPVFSYVTGDGVSEDDKYWSRGGGYSAIHALGRTDSSALYVCVGGVRGCSACCSELLTVLELTDSGINFTYPAFDQPNEPEKGPSWELTSRCTDVTRFAYDPKTKTVSFTYTSDDITPVTTEEYPGPVISGTVRFDGRMFVVEQR